MVWLLNSLRLSREATSLGFGSGILSMHQKNLENFDTAQTVSQTA